MPALEYHPLSNLFPLIEGAAFEELIADIKQHGVREAVVLYEGAILDGRNRHRAARGRRLFSDAGLRRRRSARFRHLDEP